MAKKAYLVLAHSFAPAPGANTSMKNFATEGEWQMHESIFFVTRIRKRWYQSATTIVNITDGIIEKNILFDGKDFKANIPIEAVYKFNSYRLTYNRRIISKGNFKFGLGLSAKIRDAGVSLKNRENLRENFSIGFVPLVNLLANWDISQKMGVDFFGEGIIASKGRAIDLSLSGRYSFTKNLQGNIGYRMLEGGADGTYRYNFVQLHFIFASLNYSFHKNNKEP